MDDNNLVLWYMSNKGERKYPIKSLEHAIQLADAIADSDLLDDEIDFNCFDLVDKDTEESWMSEDCKNFKECWEKWLDETNNV